MRQSGRRRCDKYGGTTPPTSVSKGCARVGGWGATRCSETPTLWHCGVDEVVDGVARVEGDTRGASMGASGNRDRGPTETGGKRGGGRGDGRVVGGKEKSEWQ